MPVTLFPSPWHFWLESLGPRGHAREADALPQASPLWQAPWTLSLLSQIPGGHSGGPALLGFLFPFGFLELPK